MGKRNKWMLMVLFLAVLALTPLTGRAAGVIFTDAAGSRICIAQPPRRVVSIYPEVTEMIYALGAGEALVGTTYHTSPPYGDQDKTVVGGFFAPWPELVKDLHPDLVFLADRHVKVREAVAGSATCVELQAHNLDDIFRNVEIVGRIFGREDAARKVITDMKERLEAISRRVSGSKASQPLRVVRFMGRESIMAPGDDSFQNAYIRAAGGVAPQWGRDGAVTELTLKEWQDYNPQVVYGCGGDRAAMDKLLNRPGWSDVDAVRNHRFLIFPCDLTCRASVRADQMVAALATALYPEEFFNNDPKLAEAEGGVDRPLDAALPGVRWIGVRSARIFGFQHKTLVVELSQPGPVLSTLHGFLDNIRTVGNHYVPPPCWGALHSLSQDQFMDWVFKVLGLDHDSARLLITGADMDNLAVGQADYREMKAVALVTAGVQGNAMRMGADQGDYYEPGTINIIILTNRALTGRAMARAVITATEAKTAALQDLDIRSTYQAGKCQATGTGTDNIMVVRGAGPELDLTGGHCKMGEMIARAVYQGVIEAVGRQNCIRPRRQVMYRLADRELTTQSMVESVAPGAGAWAGELERLLIQAPWSGFMEEALALEDAWQRGQLTDLADWRKQCQDAATEVAGVPVLGPWQDQEGPLTMATRALVLGLQARPVSGAGRPSASAAVGAENAQIR